MPQVANIDPAACYIGLDISLAETQVCVLNGTGEIIAETRVSSDPDNIAACLAEIAPHAKRLMTIPGVGPLVALAFMATIDDPRRFKLSAAVGPYLGLAPRHYQSGEIDHGGHIGHAPCPMMRSYLYESATVLLHRTSRWCRLRSWGMRLVKRIGFKRAAVAVARKIGVVMHAIWVDGTEYEPKGI